ncbi:Copper transport protein YcnJ [Microbacterium oxydans]|uniref:copper resistance CopC family protein n=1 Tax=Microbacterium oxydans TaxID=82380 RepID=UPI001DE43098|nr:copper resistance CopC family protein [Microbacterium oxydans]CAH0188100.1 Copper transport protein YcnJ [Microbacterium oxydans]
MSPVRRIAVGLAVAAVAVLAIAAPASAHDALVSSTPGVDERLDAAPESIVLTFSGELLVLGDSTLGAVVIVVDENGRDWVSGDVEVSGNTVTTPVDPGLPDAGYQVRWQVVSEDGHPISGIVPFTIGDAEPMAATNANDAASEPSDADADADASTDTDTAPDQTTTDADGIPRVLLIGAGGAVLAAAAFTLYRILRRPRTASAAPESGDAAEEQL